MPSGGYGPRINPQLSASAMTEVIFSTSNFWEVECEKDISDGVRQGLLRHAPSSPCKAESAANAGTSDYAPSCSARSRNWAATMSCAGSGTGSGGPALPHSSGRWTNAVRNPTSRAVFEVDDVRAAIAAERPDALIIDVNCWGAAAVADADSVPWLLFCPYTPFLRSRAVPPFGPGLRPWPGPLGRLRDEAVRPFVSGALDKAMLAPLNSVRDTAGAPPMRSADQLMRRAPLMLVASGEPFEYPHPGWGGSVEMIGPCAFDPPAAAPRWLSDIHRPIVLVTTSSDRQADGQLPVAAIAALADEPVYVVATYPSGVPDGTVASPNAIVQNFVPHQMVLDRAVCAITHGGMGATQKALACGVPVCIVPYGRDQFEVARRVEFRSAGRAWPPKSSPRPD
jgi:UDP:flavonoid glycosyltransferase YjiC (YdhE family)